MTSEWSGVACFSPPPSPHHTLPQVADTEFTSRGPPAEAAPRHHIAALRVSALDAERLDVELTDMLRQQLGSILAHFQPVRHGGFLCKFRPCPSTYCTNSSAQRGIRHVAAGDYNNAAARAHGSAGVLGAAALCISPVIAHEADNVTSYSSAAPRRYSASLCGVDNRRLAAR